MKNDELVGDTSSPIASIITLIYSLVDAAKHKTIVHQLYFIGTFLQAKVKNKVFVKLDSIYADYFPEYSNYSVGALVLLKSVYGMTNSGKLFFDELTQLLLEAGLFNLNVRCLSIISMHQMEKIIILC